MRRFAAQRGPTVHRPEEHKAPGARPPPAAPTRRGPRPPRFRTRARRRRAQRAFDVPASGRLRRLGGDHGDADRTWWIEREEPRVIALIAFLHPRTCTSAAPRGGSPLPSVTSAADCVGDIEGDRGDRPTIDAQRDRRARAGRAPSF